MHDACTATREPRNQEIVRVRGAVLGANETQQSHPMAHNSQGRQEPPRHIRSGGFMKPLNSSQRNKPFIPTPPAAAAKGRLPGKGKKERYSTFFMLGEKRRKRDEEPIEARARPNSPQQRDASYRRNTASNTPRKRTSGSSRKNKKNVDGTPDTLLSSPRAAARGARKAASVSTMKKSSHPRVLPLNPGREGRGREGASAS